jgi:ribosome biogenesis protein UTP30
MCVFVKDPQREYKDKLAANPVEGVTRVIGISKLRQK